MGRRKISEPSTVEVGAPVREVPPIAGSPAGRYAHIYAKVDALELDDWLPVTCGTRRQAHRLRECAKLQKYKVKRRGLAVYIARNPGYSENHSGQKRATTTEATGE